MADLSEIQRLRDALDNSIRQAKANDTTLRAEITALRSRLEAAEKIALLWPWRGVELTPDELAATVFFSGPDQSAMYGAIHAFAAMSASIALGKDGGI
jgi:hypothetical protein